MLIKDNNNDFSLKVRLSSEKPNELRWTSNSRCAAFIVDMICDVGVDDYESKYPGNIIESSFSEIVNSGHSGFSSGENRKIFYVEIRNFLNCGSRFSVPTNGTPARVQVYVVDAQNNIIDCGDNSVVYIGSLKLKYSVKNKFCNKRDLTVMFESSKGYIDRMAVYVINVNGKNYQYPITTAMLNRELQIKLPSTQDFVVQAANKYKKILKVEKKD